MKLIIWKLLACGFCTDGTHRLTFQPCSYFLKSTSSTYYTYDSKPHWRNLRNLIPSNISNTENIIINMKYYEQLTPMPIAIPINKNIIIILITSFHVYHHIHEVINTCFLDIFNFQ